MTDARRAVDTLLGHASAEAQVAIESIRERVLVATDDRPSAARVRHVLEEAIIESRQVSLTYRDRNDDVTKRSIDPVGFLATGASWSLVAHCHLRNAGRLFRLERIERATLTNRPADQRRVRETLGGVPFDTREPR